MGDSHLRAVEAHWRALDKKLKIGDRVSFTMTIPYDRYVEGTITSRPLWCSRNILGDDGRKYGSNVSNLTKI